MSLANVLAVSQAADSLVLLGDPQQLDQPTKGTHPDGTGVSALAYLLGDRQTIEENQGLFLEETWRLHPAVCDFTSGVFYRGRLKSRPGMEMQNIACGIPVSGTGLRLMSVHHEGNRNSSSEEADRVAELFRRLTDGTCVWTNHNSEILPVTKSDVLIITPYNAQVSELTNRLPDARIGTVDKFQGQEAPVVIYSMATSSPEDAPRGMEFLYSLNRLNVATSRARCVCVLVSFSEAVRTGVPHVTANETRERFLPLPGVGYGVDGRHLICGVFYDTVAVNQHSAESAGPSHGVEITPSANRGADCEDSTDQCICGRSRQSA